MTDLSRHIYQHKPLPSPRSIRVIKLKGTHWSIRSTIFRSASTASQQRQPLEVELEDVSLDSSSLSYEALSYTWDGQSPDRPIKCHGRIMYITENCEMALFGLRTESSRHLWIDSICIDQKSELEKNIQVPLMGDIYGKCERVLVWLGKATEASDQAFQYLQDVYDIYAKMLVQTPWIVLTIASSTAPGLNIPPAVLKSIQDRRKVFQESNKRMYGREGTPSSNMLSDIFSRSWFSRMWTVQELVFANKALILCGKKQLRWSDCIQIMVFLGRLDQSTNAIKNDVAFFPKLKIYQELRGHIQPGLSLGMVSPSQQNARKMSAILTMLHPLSCGNPLDKVYALNACFTALGIKDLPPVDYRLPVAQVYADYARITMVREQSLDLLYALGQPRPIQNLASWSPDWSRYGSVWKTFHERFTATKDSKPRFTFTGTDNNELHLHGLIIDTIKARPSSNLPPQDRRNKPQLLLPNMAQQIQTWREWATIASQSTNNDTYPPINHPWTSAFLLTILQNAVTGPLPNQSIPPSTLDEFLNWIGILFAYTRPDDDPHKSEVMAMINEMVDIALSRPAIHAVYFPAETKDECKQEIIQSPAWRTMMAINYGGAKGINAHIYEKTAGRTFFVTEGGYMGSGAEGVREGDVVVLVGGMGVPMVMRRGGGGGWYSLVCPVYVHGVMHGEKWPGDGGGLVRLIVK